MWLQLTVLWTLCGEEIFEHVLQMRELEKNEKDLYLMGLLDASQSVRRRTDPDLKRRKYEYSCLGVSVCCKAFPLCHEVSKKHLKNIVKHMNTHGIKTRTHGNVSGGQHMRFHWKRPNP